MTKKLKLNLLSGVTILPAVLCLVVAGSAQATEGYFANGYGTASKGMAGVGTALALDTQSAMKNPASMVKLGNRVDGAVSFFSPLRSYRTRGENPAANFIADPDAESASKLFIIPSFGVNFDQGDYSLGVTLSANGGMNTNYATTVFSGGTNGRTGIDLAQLFLGATYAKKINDKHSFGITPTVVAQRFKATGLQGFGAISSDPSKLTDNGYDYSYGYGLRLGYLGEFTDKITVGAMAQSRMEMQKFDKYAGLFADKGDFDIPPTVSLGLTYKATSDLTISTDIQRIFYSRVAAISNTLVNVTPFNQNAGGTRNSNSLGGSEGVGFGWNDLDIIKIGASYDYDDALTLRTGVSHNSSAFHSSETLFNILAPAVVDTHLSFGGTYKLTSNLMLNMAYTHAFDANINGNNANHVEEINLSMTQHDLEVGVSYLF
ncbi:MAG: hypothetical protein COB46_13195 [Rhodospirillaceae bacterium]|nr:MAG: hypothetical protein COB46_13195 [Rhodospirillaceae bacterium]